MAVRTTLGTRTLLVLGVLAIAVGCGGLRARRDGTVDRRALQRLERIGQRDMRCREAMRVVQLTNIEFQVDGCGQLREYAYTCVSRRRCDWQPVVPAVGRATVDMQCPIEQLSMAATTATQRDFIGCGRAASYQLVCMDGGCTWVGMAPAVSTTVVAPPPATLSLSVGDPSLDTAVIPPPPGTGPRPQDVSPGPVSPGPVDPATAPVPPPPSTDPSTATVPAPPR